MTTTVDITYLIPRLRMAVGDGDESRYTDEWLETSLIASVENLQKWWNYKYLLDSNSQVYRNPNIKFLFSQPPVVEGADNRPIVLMASILIKTGQLENLSWNLGAWRDAEISYSNIESGRRKDKGLDRDWRELTSILKPPQKRLASAGKGHLPGYLGSSNEYRG